MGGPSTHRAGYFMVGSHLLNFLQFKLDEGLSNNKVMLVSYHLNYRIYQHMLVKLRPLGLIQASVLCVFFYLPKEHLCLAQNKLLQVSQPLNQTDFLSEPT